MSAPNEGRQSPPPESQTGAQLQSPPASGHGVNPSSKNQEESKAQLESLSSNPKGPLDDHMAETTKKTVENVAGEIKF